jgi:hypothetical protein
MKLTKTLLKKLIKEELDVHFAPENLTDLDPELAYGLGWQAGDKFSKQTQSKTQDIQHALGEGFEPRLDLHSGRPGWKDGNWDGEDLSGALHQLFGDVASDLGIDDIGDAAFLDQAMDRMYDAGVPVDARNVALAWLEKGGFGEITLPFTGEGLRQENG